MSVILTDWPKTQAIQAHYRGVETKKLIDIYKSTFHLMMSSELEEAGGYVIVYERAEVKKELEFRKEPIPEGYR